MTTPDAHTEALEALESAIEKLTALDAEQGEIAVDAVLIIGRQFIDEDGDRNGCVQIIPRHGWQPGYITAGLLATANAQVTQPFTPEIADTGDDDQ